MWPYLQQGKSVDVTLGHPPDVMVWGIGWLLGEEKGDSLKHLVAIEGCHRQVKEESIQNRGWDVVQDILEEKHWQANQDIAGNRKYIIKIQT